MTNLEAAPLSLSIGSKIEAIIVEVAAENDKKLRPLTRDLRLMESGLDSLCLAVIVARLEDTLGVDPFNTIDDIAFPVTIGDFIGLYEAALG